MYKWKNWIGVLATVVPLTVSSCSSWTPEQKDYTAIGGAHWRRAYRRRRRMRNRSRER